MRRRGGFCLLAAAALLGCKSAPKKDETPARLKPLNLVVVTIDTLRADHLHCYGYPGIETPVLDELARRGALFENAVAQAPLTPPSHASIFTGQNPNVHGVRNTGGFVLPASSTTLAKILRQQGWDTAAFVGSAVLKKAFGFNQGFAVYDDEMPKAGKRTQYGEYAERPAAQVVDRAVRWLEGRPAGPFFLWVHVYDPHAPYEPPAAYRRRYARSLYDGEIAYADHELGRLFEAVARKAAPATTLIVVTSDHGESLGEHGEFGHGVFLYDATLRVPLIMVGPGIPPGRRVLEQARSIDILPTILALLGGSSPSTVRGISLAPAFAGKPLPATVSYAETLFPKINLGWSELRAMRTRDWKYIQAPRPELYDLSRDAGETKNVIADRPGPLRELRAQLQSVAGARQSPEKVRTSLADQRTLEQLKSLGYTAGFSPREFALTGKGIDPKDRLEVLRLQHLAVGGESATPLPRRIELLRKAVALDPSNPALYSDLGIAYAESGRYEDALQLYLGGLRNGVESPKLYAAIAELYLQAGNKDEAIGYLEKAAQVDPTDLEAQDNLAMAYLEKGRPGDAERVFRAVLAIEERDADAHNGLGILAMQQQNPAAARAEFERAVALDPELLEAQLNLAVIYRKSGDRARARACFEAFLAKAPPARYGPLIARVRRELAQLR
jgi:choline-sulfatase